MAGQTGAVRRVGLALSVAAALAWASETQAASLVATSATAFGIESASRFHAQWVSQRYWVAFHDGTTAVLYSSPDGVTWTSQGAIFSSFNPPAEPGGLGRSLRRRPDHRRRLQSRRHHSVLPKRHA